MGNPYLNSDESLVLSTHNIQIDSVSFEAILTSQRIILTDSRNIHFEPRDIPLGAIETVLNGKSEKLEPFISLTFAVSDGATSTMVFMFSQRQGEKREQESNDWVTKLKESVASARKEAQLTGIYPTAEEPQEISVDQKPADAGGAGSSDAIQAENQLSGKWAPVKPARSRKAPLSARFNASSGTKSRRSTIIAAAAILCVIIAIAGGLFVFSSHPPVTPSSLTPVVTTKTIPVQVTTLPVSTLTMTVTGTVTAVPTELSSTIIPSTGVWVRITYPAGNFTGTVGTSGRMRQVSGSGDQFYQIFTTDGIVEASIQKEDNSGNLLKIIVYNNGVAVGNPGTTTAPSGTVELHANLRQP